MLRYDSPLMETLSRAADYVLLNLLCLALCIPVVTMGAALTSKYAVSMKITRGEEPAVIRSYFSSFRENFLQASGLWGILLIAMAFLGTDWYLIWRDGEGGWPLLVLVFLAVATYMALGAFFSVFALVARFQMGTGEALKGAVAFSLIHIPRVLLGIALSLLPYLLCIWYIQWGLAIWLGCTGVMLYYNSRFS